MNDVFVFHSKSANTAPGKGVHERVVDRARYASLARVDNWRRVLSNFHVCPFEFRGLTYNTIEHAFQAHKIALADPVKAKTFSVESGTELGLGDGTKAQRARKLVRLTQAELEEWDTMKDSLMAEAAVAKYKACQEARQVLKLTGDAELWHLMTQRGKPSQCVRFIHLEHIRHM
ncbi:hypothetical protein ACK3TF_004589 [Chlorella vulgaris]